jgi:hypothetical protein
MSNLMVGCLSRSQEKSSPRKMGLGLSFFQMAGFGRFQERTDLGKSLTFLELIFIVNGMDNSTSNLTKT